MPSSRPRLPEVRSYVAAELKPLLPRRWKVISALQSIPVLAVPTAYLQFTEINFNQGGESLSIDGSTVEAVFDLVVVIPRGSTPATSEDAVDTALLDALLALKGHPQIAWGPSATKAMDADTGQMFWRVPVAVLATLPDPATT